MLDAIFRTVRRCAVGVLVLAAVGTVGAGVFSYWHGLPEDRLWIPALSEKREVQARLVRGTLHVAYAIPTTGFNANSKTQKRFGPFYVKEVKFGGTMASGAGAPFWSIALLMMIYPATTFAAGPLRRRRRRRRNQCICCGYSLRGLTEPRCPECGRGLAPMGALGERPSR